MIVDILLEKSDVNGMKENVYLLAILNKKVTKKHKGLFQKLIDPQNIGLI